MKQLSKDKALVRRRILRVNIILGLLVLLPSMWVCVLTFVISRRWNLYANQVDARVDSLRSASGFPAGAPSAKSNLLVQALRLVSSGCRRYINAVQVP